MLLLPMLLACTSGPPPLPAGDPERPDVILVSVDTLRADHLGAYGHTRDTSPFLDGLAARGARFDSAWSPSPWTLPSHVSLLSGRSPLTHGVVESELVLGPDLPLVQEVFTAAGFRSAGVVASLFVSSRYGFERGFEHFHDFGIHDPGTNLRATVDAGDVFAHAHQWVASQPPGEPVFLFLHVYDPHYPCAAPAPFSTRFDAETEAVPYTRYSHYLKNPLEPEVMAQITAAYDEEIAYTDHALSLLASAWEAAGRSALWTVVSDHGEELGERGSWGHGHTLYPEQLHVPWITAGPGVTAAVIEDRVALEDVAPTLAGLAGLALPTPDGTDRSGQLTRGETPRPRTPPARIASTSRFKTHRLRYAEPPWDLYVDLRSGEMGLCKAADDPGCLRDRAGEHPEVVRFMDDRLYPMLGTPWVSTQPLRLETDGTFVSGGRLRPGHLSVEPGQPFALLPPDAALRWTAGGEVGGIRGGPVSAAGGPLPAAGDPVRYTGPPMHALRQDLAAEERDALEALGYVHE